MLYFFQGPFSVKSIEKCVIHPSIHPSVDYSLVALIPEKPTGIEFSPVFSRKVCSRSAQIKWNSERESDSVNGQSPSIVYSMGLYLLHPSIHPWMDRWMDETFFISCGHNFKNFNIFTMVNYDKRTRTFQQLC